MGAGKPCNVCHFYPRSPCGERLIVSSFELKDCKISIHALLAESDFKFTPAKMSSDNFYPRSPCGERRKPRHPKRNNIKFLSTLSLRRATRIAWEANKAGKISIHALLAESDKLAWFGIIDILNFYPRSPCGERLRVMRRPYAQMHFYPRSPCGERPRIAWEANKAGKISIHALLAESDRYSGLFDSFDVISIHALLAESDRAPSHNPYLRSNFYPRSPCGERPAWK